jgi:hypothetical protein
MKKIYSTIFLLLIASISIWYFDILNEPVSTIDKLIGKEFDSVRQKYFNSDPDYEYQININHDLDEFNGGVLEHKDILIDSIVNVYTWNFSNHKKTIWTGRTKKKNNEIIDAIRYHKNIEF